jgi:hypothetical protein
MAEKMGSGSEYFKLITNKTMKKSNLISYIILTVLFVVTYITDSYSQSNSLSWSMVTAYNSYLMRDVHRQYADRKIELSKAFTSKEAMIAYRDDCVRRYKTIVGDFPEKGDLNAKIIGTSKQDIFLKVKARFL